MFPIFNEKMSEDGSLAFKILSCTAIEVKVEDGLSHQICKECLRQINEWYSFREMCWHTDYFLKQNKDKIHKQHAHQNEEVSIPSCENDHSREHDDIPGSAQQAEEQACVTKERISSCRNEEQHSSVSTAQDQMPHSISSLDHKTSNTDNVEEEQLTKQQNFSCNKCGNVYAVDTNLPYHMCLSLSSTSKFYICHICGKDFRGIKAMRTHSSSHSGKFQCDKCKYYFSEKLHLEVHVRKHSDIRPYVCEICGKSFMYNVSLRSHKETHNKEKLYMCDICGHRTISFGALQHHGACHKVRSFICEMCGKAFPFLGDLQRHLLTHTTERKFICSVCKKHFKTFAYLSTHSRIHKPEQHNACEVCGKTFARTDTLKEHRLTHSGERHHHCIQCNKIFKYSKGLHRHKCSPTKTHI